MSDNRYILAEKEITAVEITPNDTPITLIAPSDTYFPKSLIISLKLAESDFCKEPIFKS